MRLDFTLLAKGSPKPPVRQGWGQLGTVGTRGSIDLPSLVCVGDNLGAGGDVMTLTSPINPYAALERRGGPLLSPASTQSDDPDFPFGIKVSPASPLVPGLQVDEAGSKQPIDLEAFDERAAIMEFDGGLHRHEAEVAALACCAPDLEPSKGVGHGH